MTSSDENCQRCNGRGYLEIRLGLAGQDPREIGMVNVQWGDPYPKSKCNACNATGKRRKRKTEPSRQIANTDYTGIEMT